MITLHYSKPRKEVVLDVAESDRFYDITKIEEKALAVEARPKQSERIRLSVSFDNSKIDEVKAAEFLKRLQTVLSDPELGLL